MDHYFVMECMLVMECWIDVKQQSLTHFIFNATEERNGNIILFTYISLYFFNNSFLFIW
jgi:hypothetical protein